MAALAASGTLGGGGAFEVKPPTPRKARQAVAPVRFMLANAEALPFPDASFDCVAGGGGFALLHHSLISSTVAQPLYTPVTTAPLELYGILLQGVLKLSGR